MLRFQPAQIEAIDREEERQLALHIADLLRSHRARHVADVPAAELDAASVVGVREACDLGLSDESDILLYVTAKIVLRPDFPAEMPNLFEMLTDPSIVHGERLDSLAAATTDRWP